MFNLGYDGAFHCVFSRGFFQALVGSYYILKNKDPDQPQLFGNSWKVRGIIFVRALVGVGGTALPFLAVQRMPVGDASVLILMSPMFTSFLAIFILNEKWKAPEFFASMVAIVGMVLVTKPPFIWDHLGASNSNSSSDFDALGVFYALFGALCGAGSYLCIRLLGTTSKMPWQNVCLAQALAQIIVIPPMYYAMG
jgi:drug/metabolite transporter (DMT)-like permease